MFGPDSHEQQSQYHTKEEENKDAIINNKFYKRTTVYSIEQNLKNQNSESTNTPNNSDVFRYIAWNADATPRFLPDSS